MKEEYKLLKIEIPEGYHPTVFDTIHEKVGGEMKQMLVICCEKSPKFKKLRFTNLTNKR